ncbi:hypothetical protein NIES2135_49820 [Leptolyngbya boryana NIES-2135]|jgi:hypothetical protein|uniref:TPR repeat-containing protein n=2 Tax=Leptolyngbya boryana TaxID=1184 RepID=A0A1Z4JMX5_LEPBY|nr:hypothetical protein LBWT_16350 [Leptolyngbya boryana IAM M-101]BAS62078.1 hypothetical protein LBDG_16350 [Leptolyngbya boryana dg5]BAY58109.1 hypothetical protein NIES2135_49820 [Leptolyngbya boryana NIES-2135]
MQKTMFDLKHFVRFCFLLVIGLLICLIPITIATPLRAHAAFEAGMTMTKLDAMQRYKMGHYAAAIEMWTRVLENTTDPTERSELKTNIQKAQQDLAQQQLERKKQLEQQKPAS